MSGVGTVAPRTMLQASSKPEGSEAPLEPTTHPTIAPYDSSKDRSGFWNALTLSGLGIGGAFVGASVGLIPGSLFVEVAPPIAAGVVLACGIAGAIGGVMLRNHAKRSEHEAQEQERIDARIGRPTMDVAKLAMQRWDTNDSGKIELNSSDRQRSLGATDADGDKVATHLEVARFIAQYDENKNGRISYGERNALYTDHAFFPRF